MTVRFRCGHCGGHFEEREITMVRSSPMGGRRAGERVRIFWLCPDCARRAEGFMRGGAPE